MEEQKKKEKSRLDKRETKESKRRGFGNQLNQESNMREEKESGWERCECNR